MGDYVAASDGEGPEPIDHSARPLGPRYARESQTLADGRQIKVIRSSPAPREAKHVSSPERDAALVHAEQRLSAWAQWARENRSSVGYPSISTLYRAMMTTKVGIIRGGSIADPRVVDRSAKSVEIAYANGAEGIETRSFKPMEVLDAPEEVMQVDRAVAQVPSKPRQVLIAHYFTYGPIEERCRKTPWKRARYLQLLEIARYSVYMALTMSDLLPV
jgi:hypothetical protein